MRYMLSLIDPIYGDKEYLAAFRSIILPVAKEYKPDIILVSAGFSAAEGHSAQMGGYNVSPACMFFSLSIILLFFVCSATF